METDSFAPPFGGIAAPAPPPVAPPEQLRRPPSHLWDLLFFAAAVGIAVLMRPPFLTDWDSFDYSVAAIQGQPSPLASGRMFFVGLHALAWRAAHRWFDLPPAQAWLLFSYVTTFLAGLAAAAVFRAAYHLTRSGPAAVLAGLLWLTAPQAMVYAGSVMTEIPTVLFFALAITFAELAARTEHKGGTASLLALLAGGAFAVATNMREPLVCFGLYFAGRLLFAPGQSWGRRIGTSVLFLLSFAAISAAGLGLAAWRLGGVDRFVAGFKEWVASMEEERAEEGLKIGLNARFALLWSATVSLLGVAWLLPALVQAGHRLIAPLTRGRADFDDSVVARARRIADSLQPDFGPLAWLLLGDAAYLAHLLINHDTNVNARFAMPLMLPVLVLAGAALADASRRGAVLWMGLYLFAGLAVIVGLTVTMLQPPFIWLPRTTAAPADAWMLVALASLLVILLMMAALSVGDHRKQLAAAGGAILVIGAFAVVTGWPILDEYYYANSRWQQRFADAIAAPGALPDDAMLVPSMGTPNVQYLIHTGRHAGWVLPLPPYNADEAVRQAANARGWVVIPSGWCWPDGRDGKPTLLEIVKAYQARGKPVYVFGGRSKWRPGTTRNIEWPQIKELQKALAVGEPGPGDLCLVGTTQPDQDAPLLPLGQRKDILRKQRAAAAATQKEAPGRKEEVKP